MTLSNQTSRYICKIIRILVKKSTVSKRFIKLINPYWFPKKEKTHTFFSNVEFRKLNVTLNEIIRATYYSVAAMLLLASGFV